MRLLSIIVILLAIIFPTPTFAEMKEEDGMIGLWSEGASWVLQFPGEDYKLESDGRLDTVQVSSIRFDRQCQEKSQSTLPPTLQ